MSWESKNQNESGPSLTPNILQAILLTLLQSEMGTLGVMATEVMEVMEVVSFPPLNFQLLSFGTLNRTPELPGFPNFKTSIYLRRGLLCTR